MKSEAKKKQINSDLVLEVTKDFETRKTARRAFELQWQLNIDFLRGNQNNYITKFDTVIPAGKQFYWQEREVFNHISRMIEARLGKLATACEKLDMQHLVEKANMWSEMTGTAFYKIIWQGSPNVVVCSPFEIYPDSLTAEDIGECRSIIHAKVYRVSEIERIWGVVVAGQEIDVFDISATNRKKRTTMDNAAVVIERYERPSIAHPNGRLVIVAGNKLIFSGDLPYGIPFVRQCSELVAGCFYGKSTVERAIPVQRAYNAVKNRKTEFLNRLACGVLSVEEGSIDLETLENDGLAPGKVLVYARGTTAPKFVDTGTLPAELEREEERLLRELEMICGVSNFGHIAESMNLSGVALQIMVEQDTQRMARTVGQITKSVAEVKDLVAQLNIQFKGEK